MTAAPVSTTTRFARSPWRITLVARSIASFAVPWAVVRRFSISSSTTGLPMLGYLRYFDKKKANGSTRSAADAFGTAAVAAGLQDNVLEGGALAAASMVDGLTA